MAETKVQFDPKAEAAYILFGAVAGKLTAREIGPGVLTDYNERGDVVGVEILGVKRRGIDLGRVEVELLGGPNLRNRWPSSGDLGSCSAFGSGFLALRLGRADCHEQLKFWDRAITAKCLD